MQLTAKCLLKPTGESGHINLGDLAGHKRLLEREGAAVAVSEKGFHRNTRNLTSQVGVMYEFKLREQVKLNLAALSAAAAAAGLTAFLAAVAPNGTASFTAVKQGRSYLITSHAPLTDVVVKVGAVTFVEGTDYTIDTGSGELYIMPGGGIVDNDNVAVTFGSPGHTGYDQLTGLSQAQQLIGAVELHEFDQHAAAGVPRRITRFNGQYWFEGDEEHDGKKPAELTLKILAIDKPVTQMLK